MKSTRIFQHGKLVGIIHEEGDKLSGKTWRVTMRVSRGGVVRYELVGVTKLGFAGAKLMLFAHIASLRDKGKD